MPSADVARSILTVLGQGVVPIFICPKFNKYSINYWEKKISNDNSWYFHFSFYFMYFEIIEYVHIYDCFTFLMN